MGPSSNIIHSFSESIPTEANADDDEDIKRAEFGFVTSFPIDNDSTTTQPETELIAERLGDDVFTPINSGFSGYHVRGKKSPKETSKPKKSKSKTEKSES